MVRAHDALPGDSPLWSTDDREWATRLARQTAGDAVPLERFVAERARHAWQRLSARESALQGWSSHRGWHPAWLAVAALVGAVCGLAVDHLGGSQHINLLAAGVWAVVAWNLAVVLWALLQSVAGLRRRSPAAGQEGATTGVLRQRLARRLSGTARALPAAGPAAAGAAQWTEIAMPLTVARATALLHVAAAALAGGVVLGLYSRGLVFDYRVAWQSTFLDAASVQALLDTLLAPASALSGIAVPAVDTLRITAGAAPAGPAAPWLHLFALTLVVFAVLPRAALGAAALWRAARLSRALPLPCHEPYFQQLARLQSGRQARCQVWPHGQAPGGAALQALKARWAAAWGEGLEFRVEPSVAAGDEDSVPASASASDTPLRPSLRVAWFDLTATPEAETHGRWVRTLQALEPVVPLTVVVDEAAFAARFEAYPDRRVQRRQAWQDWARTLSVDIEFLPAAVRV